MDWTTAGRQATATAEQARATARLARAKESEVASVRDMTREVGRLADSVANLVSLLADDGRES